METRPSFAAPLAVVVFFVSLGLYVGAYAALLEPRTRLRMNPDGCCRPVRTADYRTGGELARCAFLPVHQVDRLVRREAWTER